MKEGQIWQSDRFIVSGLNLSLFQIDRYIASKKSREQFRNTFNYHGFRYIRISNLPSEPSLDDIRAYLIHTDYQEAASFQCSDPDMNAIHDMIQYTLRKKYPSGVLLALREFAAERRICPTGFVRLGTLLDSSFPPDILLFGVRLHQQQNSL